MIPTNKQPLFIITGASCVGKSTLCNELFLNEKDYIVMEADLLWNSIYDTPKDDYNEYNRLWLRVCSNISQIGKPVVLCGCRTPMQVENQPERIYFTEVHYLAVVCDDEVLKDRMCNGRGVKDDDWIKSSLKFNNWFKQNYNKTTPNITLLDTSNISPIVGAEIAQKWICERL